MEKENPQFKSELKQKVLQIFSDFMTRLAKYEELVAVGNRFLLSFQQGLEFVRQPPIDKASKLLEQIIKANESKRVLSYIEGGCITTHDSVENINKCKRFWTHLYEVHTCLLGIWNNLNEEKSVVNELECLIEDVRVAIESDRGTLSDSQCNAIGFEMDLIATSSDKEEMISSDSPQHEVTDYSAMLAIVYSMVKQDYIMQEKVVSSLNLKISSEELGSYSLMWSLRPYMNNEIIHQAWRFIP